MKHLYILGFIFLYTSCIPLKSAPVIANYKIANGKEFRRTLPNQHVFIFKNPKDAGEFNKYINLKFNLDSIDTHNIDQINYVDYINNDIPFNIDGVNYYLSFNEAEIPDKTLNLLPIAVDLATSNSDLQTDFSDIYTFRSDNWYIAISVTDEDSENCLEPLYPFRQSIIDYLKNLKEEYLITNNYLEFLFRKKP